MLSTVAVVSKIWMMKVNTAEMNRYSAHYERPLPPSSLDSSPTAKTPTRYIPIPVGGHSGGVDFDRFVEAVSNRTESQPLITVANHSR